MKSKTLLLLVMTLLIISVNAQKRQKQNEPATGYAITAAEKGGRNWKEVKLVNVETGEELRSIYQSSQETEALNARTQKPVAKKTTPANTSIYTTNGNTVTYTVVEPQMRKKIINLDEELNKAQRDNLVERKVKENVKQEVELKLKDLDIAKTKRIIVYGQPIQSDKPFATNSAAMAYDKKHERLYYTPMGINQLRYIDLKSGKIYFFEDEAFGQVKGFGDAANQITRMVIASDGNGYALTNDANHLIRFTTGKNPTITDLGALTDDGQNEKYSVHGPRGFGGDMIADASENLYLIQANRNVFKFSINNKVATYLGAIKGLPAGFSTNGAMVESGSKVIVASSESTEGYYRFDLTTMQAEKVSAEGAVFNASDLANGNLAFDKKKKDKKKEEEIVATEESKQPVVEETAKNRKTETLPENSISVYPNPVTDGAVKVSFKDLPTGKYQVQLLDLSGKLIRSQEVNVMGKMQINNFSLPEVAAGSYLIKVVSEANKVSVTNKIVVQ